MFAIMSTPFCRRVPTPMHGEKTIIKTHLHILGRTSDNY